MELKKQARNVTAVKNHLSQFKAYQEEHDQDIKPRAQCRSGVKRDCDFYAVFRPGTTLGSVEVAISGRTYSLAKAVVVVNKHGNPQITISPDSLLRGEEVENLIYKAFEKMALKPFDKDVDYYDNPYLDGYYLSIRNPGEKGLADITKAVSEGEISQQFADLLIEWEISLIEKFPKPEKIRERKRRAAEKRRAKKLRLLD